VLTNGVRRGTANALATWRRHGALPAAAWCLDSVVRRIVDVQLVNILWLDADALRPRDDVDGRFTFRFLDAEEVREFARDPRNELDESFAGRAAAGWDLCFAALEGPRLAAYGWYAVGSVEPEHAFDVALSYPGGVAYMYKGFTRPEYRGAKLHGAIMGGALHCLGERGITSLVSLVHWTNVASMRSCERLGYVVLGRMWRLRSASRTLVLAPRCARRRGIRFGSVAAARPVMVRNRSCVA